MTNKFKLPKLALEVIGYVLTSLVIASFSFCFLYFMSMSITYKKIDTGHYDSYIVSDPNFIYWLQLVCIIAALVIFFTFFLLFIGQKISYILSITNAIQILKSGDLTHKINIIGDDELTVLADTINSFSIALHNHIENEARLKKEKEELVRSLSHDIRTPLTAIISYSDFIKDKRYDSEEKLESYIEIIQSKAHQIHNLTTLLLTPGSVHNMPTDETTIDGKLMFEQFISEFTDSLEDNEFQIDVDNLGLVNFKTNYNPQDIARIFDNLYSNIIKYADNQEKIVLKLFVTDGTFTLIQSNSIKNKENIKVESNGIGLNNIKQIVTIYNGHMDFSIVNKTFKIQISLPINL